MYYGDNFSATQRATYDKHVARRQVSGDWVEDQSNPMFCHRITITFSKSDVSEVPTAVWNMALLRMCSFDSPALYRVVSVADPGDEDAKESLQKRRNAIERAWRAALITASHRIAITFDAVSAIFVKLVQGVKVKEQRLSALLAGQGSAADEILACTANQIENLVQFFDHLMPRLTYMSESCSPQERAGFINLRILSILKPVVEHILQVRASYSAASDPLAGVTVV